MPPAWGPEMRAPGIYANHSSLFDLVERRAPIVKVAGGFGSVAGPVFSRIGFLLFSDSPNRKIYQWTIPVWEEEPGGGRLTVFRTTSNRPNGLTFDHQGRLLICETGPGRVTRIEKDNRITVLAESDPSQGLGFPRDLVYNIDGSIYFSHTPGHETSEASGRTGVAAVYRLRRTQIPGASRLEMVSEECERAVGVALGPKHNRLYLADAARKNLRVQPIEDDGTLAKGRVFAEFGSDGAGDPGGLKTDELGHVYASGPGGLWVFSPSGKHLGTIVTPEPPTNCCWGRGFRGLYVTAGASVYYLPTKVPGTRTF